MIMGKNRLLPRDKLILERYSKLLQQTHCIINLSDNCVNKSNFGYKSTFDYSISQHKKNKVSFCV